MPYTSYFSKAESIPAEWKLSFPQARTICAIGDLVYKALKHNYTNAMTEDSEGYFKQHIADYDSTHTKKSYETQDVKISGDEFGKLVDIQRALWMFKGFYLNPLKQKVQVDYKWLWESVKGKVGGNANEAESLASKFNAKYCPEELKHYVHYLTKSQRELSELSSKKEWVFEDTVRLSFAPGTEKVPDRSSKAVSLDQRA